MGWKGSDPTSDHVSTGPNIWFCLGRNDSKFPKIPILVLETGFVPFPSGSGSDQEVLGLIQSASFRPKNPSRSPFSPLCSAPYFPNRSNRVVSRTRTRDIQAQSMIPPPPPIRIRFCLDLDEGSTCCWFLVVRRSEADLEPGQDPIRPGSGVDSLFHSFRSQTENVK